MGKKDILIRPWIRVLGVFLLIAIFVASIEKARTGDLQSVLFFLAFFLLLFSPIVVGKLPGVGLGVPEDHVRIFKENPFLFEEQEDRTLCVVSFVVAGVVCALIILRALL